MATPEKIAKCRDLTSGLPTDVKFVFKEDDVEEEVTAHKFVLAVASDVFKRQFFGLMQSENVINIKDASKDVFEMMIDYIYNKKIEFVNYELDCLSKLYHLADKYDIKELRFEIITSIPEHEITIENVLAVAILAEENSLHYPLSEALYDVAAAFLKQKFANKVENVYNFFSEAEVSELHGLVLMKMMGRIKFLPNKKECDNCKQVPCLNGQRVKCNSSAVVGTKVVFRGSNTIKSITALPAATRRHDYCPDGCNIGIDGHHYSFYDYIFFKCVED